VAPKTKSDGLKRVCTVVVMVVRESTAKRGFRGVETSNKAIFSGVGEPGANSGTFCGRCEIST
jgi:hypothetical protein